MTRKASVLIMVALLLVSSLAGAAGTVAAHEGHDGDHEDTTTEDESSDADGNASQLSVGQHLGVVIDAQSTEVEKEFDDARFRTKMQSATDKNAVAQERAQELQNEVADLRAEREELIEEFRTGNISKDQFLARLTMLNNKIDAKSDLAARSEVEARTNGVNADALADLRENAKKLSGDEVSAIAKSLTDKGHADVEVEADEHGNVQFRADNGATVGLDYKVQGSDDLTFDLARDNGTITLTVMDDDGEPIEGASVSVSGDVVGQTDANGQLHADAAKVRALAGESGNLHFAAEHDGERAKMKVSFKNIPDRQKLDEVRDRHDDSDERERGQSFEDAHERHHEQWEERHEEFHENVEETDEELSEANEDAHEQFHEKMDAAREEFDARWEDRRERFEADLDARANLSDEERATLEAEFEAKYEAASEDFDAKWDTRHEEFHAASNDSADTQSAGFAKAHANFHAMMDRQHEQFHARWDRIRDNRPEVGPPEDKDDKRKGDDRKQDDEEKGDEEKDGEDEREDERDNNTDEREEYDSDDEGAPFDIATTLDDSVVTVNVSNEAGAVAGATVFANDRKVGQTDENGLLTFEASETVRADGDLELVVQTDDAKVTSEVEFEVEQGGEIGIGSEDG